MKNFFRTLFRAILSGLKKSAKLCLKIGLIIIPIYLIVGIMKYTGLLKPISEFLSPIMKIFGLPGDAALVLLLANCINIYAALAVISSTVLTVKQITILGTMIGLSHTLPIETTIIKGLNVPRYLQLIIRLGMSIIVGILINILWW